MAKLPYIDIVLVKQQVASGRLNTKLDAFGHIYLEDAITGEAVKIGSLPDNYSFHPTGKWEPQFIYTYNQVDNYMQGHNGWACSECGWVTDDKHDWCTCGADMRESSKAHSLKKEMVEELLKQL